MIPTTIGPIDCLRAYPVAIGARVVWLAYRRGARSGARWGALYVERDGHSIGGMWAHLGDVLRVLDTLTLERGAQ